MKFKRSGGMSNSWLIMALAINLIIWVPGAKGAGPLEDVKCLVGQVQTILQSGPDNGQRRELIESAISNHMDFQEISKQMLGSTWSTLSAGQKGEFVHLISQLLKASGAKYFEELANAKVNYAGESRAGGNCAVHLVVARPNDKIPVTFRLLEKPEGWLIYDLDIDGVSMVSNYNSKFQRAIRAISYEGLLSQLRAKLKSDHLG